MKKIAILSIFLALAVTTSACSCNEPLEPTVSNKQERGIEFIFEEKEGYNYSAPAVKEIDGKRYVYYTTNETANEKGSAIAVRVGEKNDEGKWIYNEQKVLLKGAESGWDTKNVSCADVVEGKFSYDGKDYTKLMVYQANNVDAEKRFQVGIALSTEWDGEWVRVKNEPFIKYDWEGYGDTFGIGNPSVFSVDGQGKVMIFYSIGSTSATGTRFIEADLSSLDAPVCSGYITVGTAGLPLDGNAVAMMANADFKYDATAKTVYMVKDGYPYAGNAPQTATMVEVAKISVLDLYKAECEWDNVVSVIDGLELNELARVYSACIISDAKGQMIDVENIEIAFTSNVAATSETDKAWEFGAGLHCYQIPKTIREDA